MKRTFNFKVLVSGEEVADGAINLDQSVLDQANSEEFRKYFHTFDSDEETAAYIARHMVVFGEKLSEIEGLMMDNNLAEIVKYPFGYNDFDFEAEEASD